MKHPQSAPLNILDPPSWARRRSPLRPKSSFSTLEEDNHSRSITNTMASVDPAVEQENTVPLHPNLQHPTLNFINDNKPPPTPTSVAPDPSVNVVVRVRPLSSPEERHVIVNKTSSNSILVGDRSFNFDSVLDSDASQEDVFKLVGVPLVQSAMAGFNTSILSYGQSGSGKTYTMWGPLSAMIDFHSISRTQGLVPRIIHMLFSEIYRNQECPLEEQTNYQCRCSFLEIYNEQINDLLDSTLRNLQIKDDAKNGSYVENLTDEYVSTVDDVMQILVKGLSNRKVGTTSKNSKSSRSHVIFTFSIESWRKGTSPKGFSSLKSSRLSFIDLAGLDNEHLDGVEKECKNEQRQLKQSLSKLGNLVSILAGDRESGKVPYGDSSLTHLLQEILGGNSKVTLICAVSPENRSGTLSTLRFGERARFIENKAVINEITEDDVNGLSEQIRQLKEELLRTKTCESRLNDTVGGYSSRRNARGSLNQLTLSLNRFLILPHIDTNSDEEVDLNDENVKELCHQLSEPRSSSEDNKDISEIKGSLYSCLSEDCLDEKVKSSIDSFMSFSCDQENPLLEKCVHEVDSKGTVPEGQPCPLSESRQVNEACADEADSKDIVPDVQTCPFSGSPQEDAIQDNSVRGSSLSVIPSRDYSVADPTTCTSPVVNKSSKMRMTISSDVSPRWNFVTGSPRDIQEKRASRDTDVIRSSLQSSKINSTESLAASLQRGLEIIDYHHRSSSTRAPIFGLSFEHLAANSKRTISTSDAGSQTVAEQRGSSLTFLCSACKQAYFNGHPKDHKGGVLEEKNQNYLGNATKQEAELQNLCKEQEATIKELSNLVDEYKQGHMHTSTKEQESENKMLCMPGLTEKFRPVGEMENGDWNSKADCRISYAAGEREALLQEIQSLRKQLKSRTDASASFSLLEQIRNGGSTPVKCEVLEKERQEWTESESRWISLTEELRLDLESNRRLAEKKEMELSLEKKCTAELDDALQRALVGHARFTEHYAELQEKYWSLLGRHRMVMKGIAEVKEAAKKAGNRGRRGPAFVDALAAELSTLRAERRRERGYLKEQNRKLKIQLRDTAEAVHAAGELLVRLREAEEAAASSQEKCVIAEQEVERLSKQLEKVKRKHAMEIATMKHYLAESRLPESALEPMYHKEEADVCSRGSTQGDNQAWMAAFRPSYQ